MTELMPYIRRAAGKACKRCGYVYDDDIESEAMLAAVKALTNYQPKSSVKYWVCFKVYLTCINYITRNRNKQPVTFTDIGKKFKEPSYTHEPTPTIAYSLPSRSWTSRKRYAIRKERIARIRRENGIE